MATMHAFWSAMLTAHTVLLSVAVGLSAVDSFVKQWQVKAVGVFAAASVFILLFNFAALRKQYEAIGQRLLNYGNELTKTQREKDISTAVWRNRLILAAEQISATTLAVEACLLMWVLFR
jgi:uncharacterized membrane protein YcjF (UPF0283 family)